LGKNEISDPWMNLRLAPNIELPGVRRILRESSLNDTLFLSLWVAVAPYAVRKEPLPKYCNAPAPHIGALDPASTH